jgi:type I restriction-modification system DNA methylase subunit
VRENTNNELDKEIGPSDIARLANVSPAVVSNWKRRKANFPNPVSGANTKRPRFLESEIVAWLKENDLLPSVDDFPPSQTLEEEIRNYIEFELIKSPSGDRYTLDILLTLAWWYSRELEDPRVQKVRRLLDEKYSGEDSFDDTKSLTHYWETHPSAEMLTGLPQTGIELAEILSREFQRIVDWRRYGEIWSNEAISKCFAELLRPTPANQAKRVLIFDPCVGSGSDLLAVSERWPEASLFGAEINRLHSDVTNFLFALRGQRIEITNTNSLRENTLENQTADIVVAFPPFGVRLDKDLRDHPQWTYGDPGSSADNGWVQIVLNSLSQNGRAAILLPGGFCSQTGANLNLRKTLVRNNLLDAVISIPPGSLQSTSMPTVMFVLAKDRTKRKHARKSGEVLFIDALNSSAPPSSQDVEIKKAPYMTPNFGAEIYLNWRDTNLRFDNKSLSRLGKLFTLDELRNFQDDREGFWSEYVIRNLKENEMEDVLSEDFANFHMATEVDYEKLQKEDFNYSPKRYLDLRKNEVKSFEELSLEIGDWTKFIHLELNALTENTNKLQSIMEEDATHIKVAEITIGELLDQGVIEVVKGVFGKPKDRLNDAHVSDLLPVYLGHEINKQVTEHIGSRAGKENQLEPSDRYLTITARNLDSVIQWGDVIFANRESSKGFPKSVLEHSEFLLGNDLFAIRIIDRSFITVDDLCRWGKSSSYQTQFDRYGAGVAVKRITNKDFRRFTVIFPADQISRKYFEDVELVSKNAEDACNGLSNALLLQKEMLGNLMESFLKRKDSNA